MKRIWPCGCCRGSAFADVYCAGCKADLEVIRLAKERMAQRKRIRVLRKTQNPALVVEMEICKTR